MAIDWAVALAVFLENKIDTEKYQSLGNLRKALCKKQTKITQNMLWAACDGCYREST